MSEAGYSSCYRAHRVAESVRKMPQLAIISMRHGSEAMPSAFSLSLKRARPDKTQCGGLKHENAGAPGGVLGTSEEKGCFAPWRPNSGSRLPVSRSSKTISKF